MGVPEKVKLRRATGTSHRLLLIGGKLLPVRNRPKALNVFDAGTLDLDPRWHRGAAFYLDFDGCTVARPQRRDTLAA